MLQVKLSGLICYAACHGADGIAMIPGYPNLKGQNEQYIVSSINAYKTKQRNGGLAAVMQAQASMLSDEDIANLAAYYLALSKTFSKRWLNKTINFEPEL